MHALGVFFLILCQQQKKCLSDLNVDCDKAVDIFPVSQQDYTKTADLIFLKLNGTMKHGPRKNPWVDSGILFSLYLTVQERAIYVTYSFGH